MKKLLEAAVLAGVLLLASGCGSAEVPENKETYAYASYAHPEMVGGYRCLLDFKCCCESAGGKLASVLQS